MINKLDLFLEKQKFGSNILFLFLFFFYISHICIRKREKEQFNSISILILVNKKTFKKSIFTTIFIYKKKLAITTPYIAKAVL